MDVSLEDVSSVIRLVREVCELWDDPTVWREYLLKGACDLVNGHAGMMLEDDSCAAPGYFGNLEVTAVVGLTPTMREQVQPAISQMSHRRYEDVSENVMAGLDQMWARMQAQGWVTAAGNQLVEDAKYRSSPYYQLFRKPADCDDYLVSIRIVDVPQRPAAISIDRPHGAPPFGVREVALLKLLHDEIAPLIGLRLTTEDHLSRNGLSKRLRETLSLLLEGRSEKEVAAALQLAPRTVHDYVARLYEHFRVSSRAELLAYFVRRTPQLRAEHLARRE
jgi:DNA-binding CsgD family transcriptional regulator